MSRVILGGAALLLASAIVVGPPTPTRADIAAGGPGAPIASPAAGPAPTDDGTAGFVGACDEPCNPPTQLPTFNERYELKGTDSITSSEIKFGIELRSMPDDVAPGHTCEASGTGNIFLYGLAKLFGREFGLSASATLDRKVCYGSICISDGLGCAGDPCESIEGSISLAQYNGVEFKADFLGKLGGFGAQLAKFAKVEGKLSGRYGLGVRGTSKSQHGSTAPPEGGTTTCTNCCSTGRDAGYLEAGPQFLIEGKGAIALKLWKFELEGGVGAKACGAATGKIGVDCDGRPYAEPDYYYYAAACLESMTAITAGPGPVQYREINNEASVCLPLGFWDFCFDFPRCVKIGDPGRACPSGSPNPE